MFPGGFGPDCERIVMEVKSIFTAGTKLDRTLSDILVVSFSQPFEDRGNGLHLAAKDLKRMAVDWNPRILLRTVYGLCPVFWCREDTLHVGVWPKVLLVVIYLLARPEVHGLSPSNANIGRFYAAE